MFGVVKRNPCLSLPDAWNILTGQPIPLPMSMDPVYSYSGYSRFALRNIFTLLAFSRGSKVLLPAYICDVVLLPFAELGLEPLFYGITDDFQPVLNDGDVSRDTKAIITVNYFGMSIDYPAVEAFVKKHDLTWINDNAHGYASYHGTTPLDEFGDFSITSFRKVLPTINGARTRVNQVRFRGLFPDLDKLNNSGSHERALFRFLLVTLLGAVKYRPWKHPDYSNITAFSECDLMPHSLDRFSGRILQMTEEHRVRDRRHALYQEIEAFLKTSNYSFITVIDGLLQDRNSPMIFPIYVPDTDQWRSVLSISRLQGIDIHTWPSMPRVVIHNNVFQSVERWNKLLCLPIHQDLDADEYCASLGRIFNAVEAHRTNFRSASYDHV